MKINNLHIQIYLNINNIIQGYAFLAKFIYLYFSYFYVHAALRVQYSNSSITNNNVETCIFHLFRILIYGQIIISSLKKTFLLCKKTINNKRRLIKYAGGGGL